jgi:hypothetical protein
MGVHMLVSGGSRRAASRSWGEGAMGVHSLGSSGIRRWSSGWSGGTPETSRLTASLRREENVVVSGHCITETGAFFPLSFQVPWRGILGEKG